MRYVSQEGTINQNVVVTDSSSSRLSQSFWPLHPEEDTFIGEEDFLVLTEFNLTMLLEGEGMGTSDYPVLMGLSDDWWWNEGLISPFEPTDGPWSTQKVCQCCHSAKDRPIMFGVYSWLYASIRMYPQVAITPVDVAVTINYSWKGAIFSVTEQQPDRVIASDAVFRRVPSDWYLTPLSVP